MTRQIHGLAAETGLIEALRPAGYEFETGYIKCEGGDGLRRPFRVVVAPDFEAGAVTLPA
jgi:hypothetical protein